MKAPGVEVRRLRQMTGGASFNEVFFNEVRVPDDHRLGDVNQGWTVALTTLMNERAAIGGRAWGGRCRHHADRRDDAPLRASRKDPSSATSS
jgi:acyl-CoA dehydrogenase